MEKELCVRCGKESAYDINTPITVRLYYVEGAGQLCEACYSHLYRLPAAFLSDCEPKNRWKERDGQNMNLFVIGNGFDKYLHHLPTAYSDFRDYLIEKYPGYEGDDDLIPELTLTHAMGNDEDMNQTLGLQTRIRVRTSRALYNGCVRIAN